MNSRGLERRRAAHRLGLRRWDGGGVGPPDRCTAARTDWAPRWVTSVALSGDGRYIVSGSGDRTVAVWDLQTGARLHELTGHQGG